MSQGSEKSPWDQIPRRCKIEMMTDAELAIREAVRVVEALPADVRLTNAVVLLSQAQESVADYFDHSPLRKDETGWLLDDGQLCVGVNACLRFGMVNYTDPGAIRFSREEDAENFRQAILDFGLRMTAARSKPVNHLWSGAAR